MTPTRPAPERTAAGPSLPDFLLRRLAEEALAEDLRGGDVTTDLVVPEGSQASGTVAARADGVLAGLPVAHAVFRAADPGLEIEGLLGDGDRAEAGDAVCRIRATPAPSCEPRGRRSTTCSA